MISYLFSIFCAGGFLLGCAILVNAVIQFFGIMNWDDLLMSIKKRSLPKRMTWMDVVWLFIGYPLVLGYVVYLSQNFIW